ncbi:MAG: serine/threonine protein kinase [Nannocystaceae bacterium]|nr:serine/threonine protein kinase [Nannocystaceae bacterium]
MSDRDEPATNYSSESWLDNESSSEMAVLLRAVAAAPSVPFADDDDLAGTTIGSFRLGAILGSGGMGVVYAAVDTELERPVALKLHRTGLKRDFAARTRLEARAMARVSHPNVVQIFDVGTWEGRVYIAMELVDGETLATWLRKQPRSWRDVVTVFMQAGQGLAAAHGLGIVHRDFKPQNVLLGDDGRARVADFGLARDLTTDLDDGSMSEPPLSDSHLTRTGTIMGTPAYMSPEQLEGAPSDARSDQFSFCVSLFSALYGVRPFSGRRAEQLLLDISQGKVAKASSHPPVPKWLRALVLRGLRYDPAERHPDMAALVAAMQQPPHKPRWLAGIALVGVGAAATYAGTRPVQAACLDATARTLEVWDDDARSHLTDVFAATQLPSAERVSVQVAESIDAYLDDWRSEHERVCDARTQHGETVELDMRSACLDTRLSEIALTVKTLGTTSARTLSASSLLVNHVPPVSQCRTDGDPDNAELKPALAAVRDVTREVRILRFSGQHQRALDQAEALELGELARAESPVVIAFMLERGIARSNAKQADAARTDFEYVFEIAERLRHDRIAARAATQLATLHSADPDATRRWARTALAIGKRSAGNELAMAMAYDDLCHAAVVSGTDTQECHAWLDKGIRLAESAGPGPRPESVAEVLRSHVGLVHKLEGNYGLAISAAKKNIAYRRAGWGSDDLTLGVSLFNLGNAQASASQYADSESSCLESARIAEVFGDIAYENLANAWVCVGVARKFTGRSKAAAAAFDKALAALDLAGASERVERRRFGIYDSLAEVAVQLEDYDKAEDYLVRSMAASSTSDYAAHNNEADHLYIAGNIARGRHDYERQYEIFQQRLVLLHEAQPARQISIAMATMDAVRALVDLNRIDEATKLLDTITNTMRAFKESAKGETQAFWDQASEAREVSARMSGESP